MVRDADGKIYICRRYHSSHVFRNHVFWSAIPKHGCEIENDVKLKCLAGDNAYASCIISISIVSIVEIVLGGMGTILKLL